jgi:hypothetical protein
MELKFKIIKRSRLNELEEAEQRLKDFKSLKGYEELIEREKLLRAELMEVMKQLNMLNKVVPIVQKSNVGGYIKALRSIKVNHRRRNR